MTDKRQIEKLEQLSKALEILRKERSIYAVVPKSEYEENCFDSVISSLDNYLNNTQVGEIKYIV